MERKRKSSSYKMKKSPVRAQPVGSQWRPPGSSDSMWGDMFSSEAERELSKFNESPKQTISEWVSEAQGQPQMNQDSGTMSNVVGAVGDALAPENPYTEISQAPQQTNITGKQRGRGIVGSPMSKRKKFIMKRNKK